jgi:hypothetical protein
MKLGKQSPLIDPRTLKLSTYLNIEKFPEAPTSSNPVPLREALGRDAQQ